MAKQTGLGDNFYVGQYDLSGDVGAVQSLMASRAVIDVSPINITGFARLLGRADGTITFNAFYNPSAGQAAAVLQTVSTAAGTAEAFASYFHGTAVGNDAASLRGKQVDYNMTVGADQSVGLAVSVQAAAGAPLEWGRMMTTGRQVFSGTAANAAYDHTAATAFGGAAYLHAFALTSGTATVTVEGSPDNVTFTAISGLAFTVTAAGAQRLATTTTTTSLPRYTRVNCTGTFTGLDCALNLIRYTTSQT